MLGPAGLSRGPGTASRRQGGLDPVKRNDQKTDRKSAGAGRPAASWPACSPAHDRGRRDPHPGAGGQDGPERQRAGDLGRSERRSGLGPAPQGPRFLSPDHQRLGDLHPPAVRDRPGDQRLPDHRPEPERPVGRGLVQHDRLRLQEPAHSRTGQRRQGRRGIRHGRRASGSWPSRSAAPSWRR